MYSRINIALYVVLILGEKKKSLDKKKKKIQENWTNRTQSGLKQRYETAAIFQKSTLVPRRFTFFAPSDNTRVNVKVVHSGVSGFGEDDVRNKREILQTESLLLHPHRGPAVQKDKNM